MFCLSFRFLYPYKTTTFNCPFPPPNRCLLKNNLINAPTISTHLFDIRVQCTVQKALIELGIYFCFFFFKYITIIILRSFRTAYNMWMRDNGGAIVNIVVINQNGFPMMS